MLLSSGVTIAILSHSVCSNILRRSWLLHCPEGKTLSSPVDVSRNQTDSAGRPSLTTAGRDDYVRAASELTVVLRALHPRASKQAQAQIYEDVSTCIQHCSQ